MGFDVSTVTSAARVTATELRASLRDLGTQEISRNATNATVGLKDSATAVTKGLEAGKFIQETLEKIRTELFQGDMDRTVLDDENYRFKRQSTIALLLGNIDNAVAQAEHENVNLISSKSNQVRLRTTPYGGTMLVQPKPLDTNGLGIGEVAITAMDLRSLGLENFGMIADSDSKKAAEMIDHAITLAANRMDELKEVAAVMQTKDTFLSAINNVRKENDKNFDPTFDNTPPKTLDLSRGLFVDIFG